MNKTWLPDKKKYISYIDKIYANGWVTNRGPLVRELEVKLADYLGVKNIVLVANGTIALETAYRLLKLKGDVITTPFSFVATTSSLVANNLNPVFADINPYTFNIDPKNIEQVMTQNTRAIVPTHIFGNACEVEAIDKIAKRHNLKVIYDAAHTFGIKYKGESLLNHGDVSILSFHATKIFHTIEGGALIINNDALVEEARLLINFGIDGLDSVKSLGTNGKMNEFEAAMGLCMLDDMDLIIQKSQEIYEYYYTELKDLVTFQQWNENATNNYSYCPIIFSSKKEREKAEVRLFEASVFPRRYFTPSLDTLSYI
ncbi:MAG: DegT/DnrJ/EryC1/StrS family aminotransferase, partial [Bacteroidales bacterium]|nr:DegT/DnrJ/EryC1/StrS family aminotransferase [Bacteroidales bacterium]